MSPESLELANAWLTKAKSDLATAKLLIEGNERYLDTGSYHCQQAAEKAIKAWLTAVEVVFTKTHSLEILVKLCIPSEPGFQQFLNHAIELTPFATEFRYPGEELEPLQEEASRALSLADDITTWISRQYLKLHPTGSGFE
jgi:HEPN domain-containing protein